MSRRSWRVRRNGYQPDGCTADPIATEAAELERIPREGKVERFQGVYQFLSNFFWSPLNFEGLRYPSVEHAFQAAKLRENTQRLAWGFTESISFGQAKRLGRQVPLREDWKEVREEVMASCLRAKFEDPTLRKQLLSTGIRELVDGHSGSPDLIWGYHIPSQRGENRLGILLMDLRAKLQLQPLQPALQPMSPDAPSKGACCSLFQLDWPVRCLHDGLPHAYGARIREIAVANNLAGCVCVLPRRKICIALCGQGSSIDAWEHRMRTENVDVNSRGRPCRERMLVELLRESASGDAARGFSHQSAEDWPSLCRLLSASLGLEVSRISDALGPEVPELPRKVSYLEGRSALLLDGQRVALCLNESATTEVAEALLGSVEAQSPLGPGEPVPLEEKTSIFGGKFARELRGLLSDQECQKLIDLSEKEGYGLAGSRGFNPFARFAFRCFLDAPLVAMALTRRLAAVLPKEYPKGSGNELVGLNRRLRFLKYTPGMHHADHTDCAHEDEAGRSYLTLQVYLNTGFSGGRTTFISDRLVPIEPTAGGAIIFDHELYHRGGMVTSGLKYALRMDVSYGKPALQTSPKEYAEERRRGRWGRK